MQAGLYVVQHGQLGKQADVLERARHAHFADIVRLFPDQVLPVQPDAAIRRAVHAGQHVEHSGFARAVRTDQAYQPALLYFHGKLVNSAQAAERNPQRSHFKHCHITRPPSRSFPACSSASYRAFPAAAP